MPQERAELIGETESDSPIPSYTWPGGTCATRWRAMARSFSFPFIRPTTMTTSDHDDRWHDAVDLLCSSSARQILEGISFAEFRARMVGMLGQLLKTITIPDAARTPEFLKHMATVVALEIWNATPIPENRFARASSRDRSATRLACAVPGTSSSSAVARSTLRRWESPRNLCWPRC